MVNLTISEQDDYLVVLLRDHFTEIFSSNLPTVIYFQKEGIILVFSWSHFFVGTNCLSAQAATIVIPPYFRTSSNMD